MALARGYDVSDYQSGIPADAAFVIIKASEGARTRQANWRAKRDEARRRGIVVGYYHFFHAENPVAGEVAHFCDTVGQVPENELLVLDFEPYDQGVADATATAKKNQWLAAVKARYPRHKVGVYTNRDWWFRTDDNAGDFLWIADYQAPAGKPRIQAGWRIHQYTDRPLDTNVFNGDAAALRAWAGGAALTAAQVAASPQAWVPPPRVTRAQLGWPASAAAAISRKQAGVKIHYLGTPYSFGDHAHCAGYVRGLRASHLANKAENYSDIAYNELVCEHGVRFEGRGYNKRTGANGNATLNATHYAVCALLGSSGSTEPTQAQLHGLRDAIEAYRQHGGAGLEIRGHRDGYATSCPGGPLYAWVQAGAPRPATPNPGPGPGPVSTPVPEDDMRIIHGPVTEGFDAGDDPVVTVVVPPSFPAGKRAFVNIASGFRSIAVRVHASAGGAWHELGRGLTGENGNSAFFELPAGCRSLHIKRIAPDDLPEDLQDDADALGYEIAPDTPASWNVEVV